MTMATLSATESENVVALACMANYGEILMNLNKLFPGLSPRMALWLVATYGLRHKNLTYAQLGALTGITHTYLAAVFNGKRKLTKRVAEKVGPIFGVDLTMFL